MMKTSFCRACGAEIGFIKTKAGKTMPVDAKGVPFIQVPAGKELFVLEDGTTEHGFRALPDSQFVKTGYVSHFATCPEADKFRKPRKSDRKKG